MDASEAFKIVMNKRLEGRLNFPCQLAKASSGTKIENDPYGWVDKAILSDANKGHSVVYFDCKRIFTEVMDFYAHKDEYLESHVEKTTTGKLWWKKTTTKVIHSWAPGYEKHGGQADYILNEVAIYLENKGFFTKWFNEDEFIEHRILAVKIYPD